MNLPVNARSKLNWMSQMFPSANGNTYSINDLLGPRAFLAIIFTSVHCPYARAYFDVLPELAEQLARCEMHVVLVSCNKSASRYPEGIITLRRRFSTYPLPFIRDADGIIAAPLGPRTTPSAVVVDRDGRIRYRGALDDRFRSPGEWVEGAKGHWPWDGSEAWIPSNHYLLSAAEALYSGKEPHMQGDEVGCAIRL